MSVGKQEESSIKESIQTAMPSGALEESPSATSIIASEPTAAGTDDAATKTKVIKPTSLSSTEESYLTPHNLKSGPHVSYMVRRETHSSRAITSVFVALLLLAALAYMATEGILGMMGKPPLLASWTTMIHTVVMLPMGVDQPVLISLGALLIVVGLFLLAKAVLPGPLGRHSIEDKRAAYIVDDAVIASAVSKVTREEAGLGQGQVTTQVSRRALIATVTPTSGIPLNGETLQKALSPKVKRYNLRPDPKVHIHVRTTGAVSK
ncbi:MAG: DUF6286 domain-containing protein [Actinomycetaceae bacterium]|nr:DUF6286 domain-containing protein [Actinomycetaceae bacterium]